MKVCNKCNVEKSFSEYYKNKNAKDKLQVNCKQCAKQTAIEYYNNNKPKHLDNINKWQNNNQDKIKQSRDKRINVLPSSVYKITNEINGRQYVGKSEKPSRRKYEHFIIHKSDKSQSYNELLQTDIKEYGKHNFKFEIIEHCEINKLSEREQYWINTLQPYYNIQSKTDLETLKTTI